MTAIIEIRDFSLELPKSRYVRPVLDSVTLAAQAGRSIGIVGESGSGKSLLSRAILGDLPDAAVISGSVQVGATDTLTASASELRRLRQREVGMVFQDPRASVNPVHPISDFLIEHVVRAGILGRTEAERRAIELLADMRISDPAGTMRRHPSELSGGMLQRVVIAGALMARPSVLLCDEATTALDVTTQAEIVAILRDLTRNSGVTLLFVTHDLELAGDLCDDLCVLYAGRVLELGPTAEVLALPKHPYTSALLESTPRLADEARTLPSIPGVVLPLTTKADGCVFADRCQLVGEECRSGSIAMRAEADRRWRCVRSAEDKGGRA